MLQGTGNERRGIVTEYSIEYFSQTGKWANLNNSKTGKEIFTTFGNLANPDTVTDVDLANPVTTLALRIYPQLWEGVPFFKIKMRLCDPQFMSAPSKDGNSPTDVTSETSRSNIAKPKHQNWTSSWVHHKHHHNSKSHHRGSVHHRQHHNSKSHPRGSVHHKHHHNSNSQHIGSVHHKHHHKSKSHHIGSVHHKHHLQSKSHQRGSVHHKHHHKSESQHSGLENYNHYHQSNSQHIGSVHHKHHHNSKSHQRGSVHHRHHHNSKSHHNGLENYNHYHQSKSHHIGSVHHKHHHNSKSQHIGSIHHKHHHQSKSHHIGSVHHKHHHKSKSHQRGSVHHRHHHTTTNTSTGEDSDKDQQAEETCEGKPKWRYTKAYAPPDDAFKATGNSNQAWRGMGGLNLEPFEFNIKSKNRKGKTIKKVFLQVSFKKLTKIYGLKIGGSSNPKKWGCITKFGILYKFERQMTLVYYKDDHGSPRVFNVGKRTMHSCGTPMTFELPVPIITTTIRIYPERWEGLPKIHINFLTCQLEGAHCMKPLLANGKLKRLQFGDMDKGYQDKNSIYYITIKLSKHSKARVKAVKFEQGPSSNSVTKFVFQFHDGKGIWYSIKDKHGEIEEFSTDIILSKTKPTVVFFYKPVETKWIRIYPQAWKGLSPMIKIDFLGCQIKDI